MKRVYFIRPVGMRGPIKIGTSIAPSKRRDALAVWSPFPLEIVAEIEGDDIEEARFHRRFLESHERLEWFTWSPELQSVIDRIRAGTFDIDELPQYAGRLATLLAGHRSDLSELDLEYVAALRQLRAIDYRIAGFYWGRRPDIGQFVKIKSDRKKREIIDGLRDFHRRASVKLARKAAA